MNYLIGMNTALIIANIWLAKVVELEVTSYIMSAMWLVIAILYVYKIHTK